MSNTGGGEQPRWQGQERKGQEQQDQEKQQEEAVSTQEEEESVLVDTQAGIWISIQKWT